MFYSMQGDPMPRRGVRRDIDEAEAELHEVEEAYARGEGLTRADLDAVRQRVADAKRRFLDAIGDDQPGR